MKSRERIQMTINHQEPDRVPIDLGCMPGTGIAAITYNKVRKMLGVNKGLARICDFVQQLAYPEEQVIEKFHIDAINAGQGFLQSEDDWKEWTLDDGSKCLIPKFLDIRIDPDGTVYVKNQDGFEVGKKPKTCPYVEQAFFVYKDLPSIPEKLLDEKDFTKHVWSIPRPPHQLDIYDDQQFEILVEGIKKLYETTDYSIYLGVGCCTNELGWFLRDVEQFMCDVYTDEKKVIKFLDSVMDTYIKKLDRIIKGVGKYVDFLGFSDDLGHEEGPFMSAEKYKKIFQPFHKKTMGFVHDNSDCKVFYHSCGSIFELIPGLIESGIDILHPVQTTAKNMEPEKLKKEFGNHITFWGGGVDPRRILTFGTPKEVSEDVKRRMDIFARGGGFVFNGIHNILSNVPPENVIAMYEAAYEFGKY